MLQQCWGREAAELPSPPPPLPLPPPMPSIGSCPAPLSLGPWTLLTLASSSLMCGAEMKVHGGHQSHFSGYKSFFLPFRDEVSRQVIFIAGLRQEPSEKINKVTHTSPSHSSAPLPWRGAQPGCADTGTPTSPEGPRKLLPGCRDAGRSVWGEGLLRGRQTKALCRWSWSSKGGPGGEC